MLASFRKIAKGPIGWLICVVIFIPFVFFGIQSYFVDSADRAVIKVGDESISNFEFNSLWQQQLNQYQGQNLSNQVLNSYRLSLVRDLAGRLAVIHHLKQENYNISNQLLGSSITSNQTFFEQGQFSKQRYLDLLKQNRISLENYENSIREDLKVGQFNSFLNNALFANSTELNQISRVVNQRRTGGYQVFDSTDFIDQVQLTKQEIKQRYNQNLEFYQNPEKVKIDYLLIDKNNLRVSIRENEVKAYYQNHDSRNVREIFISHDANSQEKERLANELYLKLKNNEADFDSLLIHSDDVEGLERNGNLGLIERNTLGPDFDEVIFALAEGEVGLVKSDIGTHILLVDEIFDYKNINLDEVKQDIEQKLTQQKQAERYIELVNEVATINYDNFDSLATLANALSNYGIEVQTSDYFDFSGNNLAGELNQLELIEEAFSDKLKAGSNSSVIELDDSRVIVFRHQNYLPNTQKSFEQAQAEIMEELKLEKAISELTNELEEKITIYNQSEENIHNLFNDWQNFNQLSLEQMVDAKINPEIIRSVFNLTKPLNQSKMNLRTIVLSNNQVAVIGLDSIQFKADDEFNNQDFERASNIFEQIINRAILDDSINLLGTQYEVFIDDELLGDNLQFNN